MKTLQLNKTKYFKLRLSFEVCSAHRAALTLTERVKRDLRDQLEDLTKENKERELYGGLNIDCGSLSS